MAVEMAIWRMTDRGPVRLQFAPLQLESRLEDMVMSEPSLIGKDLLVIGRQVVTPHSGRIDVLAVDSDARLHVIEIKRDRTPREVVAQVLDYGSWVRGLTLDEVTRLFGEHNGGSFDSAFAERFGVAVPDVFNPDQQLTIVAAELDPASDRIVQYLAEQYGVPVNAVFFRHFQDGGNRYLARTWLIAPEEAEATSARVGGSRKVRPWNGQDFYVIQGTRESGRWAIARKYSVLTAGGGTWYWRPLRNLAPGKRVFAYVGGAGYVGVGSVAGPMTPLRDFECEVDGKLARLVDQPDIPERIRQGILEGDEESTEYGVPVRWERTLPLEQAISERGLFASQVTVCKLRDERTIDVLTKAFGLEVE